jgi:hypothetical protein
MTAHRALVTTLVVCLASTAAVRAEPDPETAKTIARLAKDRVEAARTTFETEWKNYREGRRIGEDTLYRWSVRWLEAEKFVAAQAADRLAAYEGHRKRMRELDALIGNLQRAGQVTVDEVSAAAFYKAEAEIWFLQVKGEKKE